MVSKAGGREERSGSRCSRTVTGARSNAAPLASCRSCPSTRVDRRVGQIVTAGIGWPGSRGRAQLPTHGGGMGYDASGPGRRKRSLAALGGAPGRGLLTSIQRQGARVTMDRCHGGQLQLRASARELVETLCELDARPGGVWRAWIQRQFGDLLVRCGLVSDLPVS